MVSDPDSDSDMVDRPRGILSEADRRYLLASEDERKENYSRQARSKRERAIRERAINGILDFTLLEHHLESGDRDIIFDAFDANEIFSDTAEAYVEAAAQIGSLSDMIAFVYRETKESEDRHPPFEMILEHGIQQAESVPGARMYESYDVDLSVEKNHRETVNIDTLIERIDAGETEMLTEGEKATFIRLVAASEAFEPEVARDEFNRRLELMRERYDDEIASTQDFNLLMSASYSRERYEELQGSEDEASDSEENGESEDDGET